MSNIENFELIERELQEKIDKLTYEVDKWKRLYTNMNDRWASAARINAENPTPKDLEVKFKYIRGMEETLARIMEYAGISYSSALSELSQELVLARAKEAFEEQEQLREQLKDEKRLRSANNAYLEEQLKEAKEELQVMKKVVKTLVQLME